MTARLFAPRLWLTRFGAHAPRVSTLLALALLAGVAAHWTWRLLLPSFPPAAPPEHAAVSAQALAAQVAQSRLIGGAAAPVLGAPSADAAAHDRPPAGLELRGVYAPRVGRGFAVFVIGSETLSVLAGETLPSGHALLEVQADHVILGRGAARHRIAFSAGQGAVPAEALRPQVRLQVQRLGEGRYALSRSAFQEAAKDPAHYVNLGRFSLYPRGGAVLEASPAGGLAEQLGLRPGDVVTHIDGVELRNPEDAAQLFQRIVARERVELRILRERAAFGLTIDILP
ncbi:MAG: PDZ domain-containing protein [Thiobacillaceae bacterium]|nr:PDZ domain-containing protein [Thiobacillaceae bacterium]MDW8323390.1 type II secretion system protein N [Burkholderiales bacterium]